jgi:ribosomal protein L32
MTASIDHIHAVKPDVVADDQALSRVAPVTHAHVNSLGRYELDRQPPPSRRRSRRTHQATTARPAPSCGPCATSLAPTTSASHFTATSNKSGTTRTFHSLSDALKENINARVWAGIHFRTAVLQGVKLGTKVARYLHKHYFQPVHHNGD